MSNRRVSEISRHLNARMTTMEDETRVIERNETGGDVVDRLSYHVADLYQTAFGKVEFSAKKHGGMLVANVLKAHGVKFIFTLSGGHISPILAAAEKIGIRVPDVRHEVDAVFAADAVFRMTGTIGVAAVTAGPGVTNTVTAMKNAQMAESAVLLLGGAAATLSKGRGALQDIEQIAVLKSICKYSASVGTVRDIVPTLREAIQQALSGVPGPVFVELPLDVLYPITEATGGMSLSERKYCRDVRGDEALQKRVIIPAENEGESVKAYLATLQERDAVFLEPDPSKKGNPWYVQAFMKAKLRHLYANAWPEEQDFGPLPLSIPLPSDSDVAATVKLLQSAKRPLILLGSQSTIGGPEAAAALAAAANSLNIPCFLGGMARGLLGKNSSIHIRQNRGQALAKADLVILGGAICDFRLSYGQGLSKKSKIVTVNRSKAGGTMNAGMFWNPNVVVESDVGLFMRNLAGAFQGGDRFASWTSELKSSEKKTDERNLAKAKEPAYSKKAADGSVVPLVNPLAFFLALENSLPENAVLIGDGGDCVATSSYILRPRAPLGWLDAGAFGTLGCGGGFALGIKMCCPEKEVYIIYGDGSCGYSIAEFDSFQRHRAPVCAVVCNDAGWTQIEREQVPMFGTPVACLLSYRDYDLVAKGYGAEGVKIASPQENIAEKLQATQNTLRNGNSVCVNVLIGGTDFREGSISV